jgi:PAS domain S-box-containing protein
MTKTTALMKHFDRAQRLSNSGSWEWDIVSNAVSWSDNTFRIFGVLPNAFAPSYAAFLERVHPDDRASVERAVRRAIEGIEPYDLDHRIVLPDGSVRHVRSEGQTEFDAEGWALRMLGTTHDLTKVRANENSLKQSEALLASMLQISPEPIVVADGETRIMAFSAGAEEMFGYSAAEVIGLKTEMLIPRRLHQNYRDQILRFLSCEIASNPMHERWEIIGLRKDGEECPAEASLEKLKTAEGFAFIVIMRDLSKQKAIRLRLIEAR